MGGLTKAGKMNDEFPIGLQGRMDQKEFKEVIDFLDVKKKVFFEVFYYFWFFENRM